MWLLSPFSFKYYRRLLFGTILLITMVSQSRQVEAQDADGGILSNISLDSFLPDIDLPPISVAGSVGYSFMSNKTRPEDRTFNQVLTGNLMGSSYIWAPWLISTHGNVMAAQTTTTTGSTESVSDNITGNITFNILPSSYFPTILSYSRNNTTRSAGDTVSTGTSNAFRVISRVNWDETLNVMTVLDYSISSQKDAGDQINTGISTNIDKTIGAHAISLALSHRITDQKTVGTEAGSESDTSAASLRYGFSPWDMVFYDSTSNVVFSSTDSSTQSAQQTLTQTTSTLRWTPEAKAFSVAAVWTGRTEDSSTDTLDGSSRTGNSSSKGNALNGRVGLNYLISDKLNADASVDGSFATSETSTTGAAVDNTTTTDTPSSTLSLGASGGVNYIEDPGEMWGFAWYWNASARASARQSSINGVAHSESVSTGQSLMRNIEVAYVGPVGWSINQNVTTSNGSGGQEFLTNLNHNTSFSYRQNQGNASTMARVSAQDSRLVTGDQTVNQLINLQISQNIESGASSSWAGNLSVQMSKSGSGSGSDGADDKTDLWEKSSSGSIAYQTRNIFDIRDLNFSTQLSFDASTFLPISFINAKTEEVDPLTWNRRWNGKLNYRLGKVIMEGVLKLSQDQNRVISDSFFFNIRRNF